MQTHALTIFKKRHKLVQKQAGLHNFTALLITVTLSTAGWFLLCSINSFPVGLAYVGAITTIVGGGLMYAVSRYVTDAPGWVIIFWTAFGVFVMLEGISSQGIRPVTFFMWLGACPLAAAVFVWMHRDILPSEESEKDCEEAVPAMKEDAVGMHDA